MKGYAVVFEGDDELGYSAYSPDLPGVAAAADTRQETESLMVEAMAAHIAELRDAGSRCLSQPRPTASPSWIPPLPERLLAADRQFATVEIGRIYLERGRPVTVLTRWAGQGPRNVLIRRETGQLVVRPFRGLRRIRQAPSADASPPATGA